MTGTGPVSTVHAADLDGDGDADVLLGIGRGVDEIGWYENLGGGRLALPQPVAHDAYGDIEAVDVDGDGDRDFAAAFTIDAAGDGQVSWFENHGSGGDDHGNRRVTNLVINRFETVHFNSGDLEIGNVDKGIFSGVGTCCIPRSFSAGFSLCF